MFNKVALATLGCKINQYDSAVIAEEIQRKGFKVVPFGPDAEVFIINTCTVTGRTDYKGRQLIRKARGLNPSAVLIVTGCYAQVQAQEIAKIPGVDYILGNAEKGMITSVLADARKRPQPEISVSADQGETQLRAACPCAHSGHTRAFLKIQDGCNESCAYCIVPRARGRSRSLPPADILEQIAWLATEGFKEVVLCGVHLGHYGNDLSPQTSLLALLENIERKGDIPRVRVSSIEPNELQDELLRLFAEARTLCPHFHLPLQSGDPRILKAMHRTYGPEDFSSLVLRTQSLIPDAAIGIDVIVGFPGEGSAEFEHTRQLVASLPVTYLHVFPYSNRPGTAASILPGQVAPEAIDERSETLRALGKEKRAHFYRRFLGSLLPVLVESSRDPITTLLKGFSRNYIPIILTGEDGLQNREVAVKVTHVEGLRVVGSIA